MQAATASMQVDGLPSADRPASDDPAAFAQQALRNVRIVSCGYLADGVVLSLFALIGTVQWVPVAAYAVMGLLIGTFWTMVFRKGWTLGAGDPQLPMTFTLSHQMLRLTGMALMPPLSIVFLLDLFIVFVWLAVRGKPRQTVTACALTCLGAALVLAIGDITVHSPNANALERVLSWGVVSLALWQCTWIGEPHGTMTASLRRRGHELAALIDKARYLAHHDELTGLLNRRSVLATLKREQQQADSTGRPLTVVLLDLDHFKALNETLGHAAGDRALRHFARTVQQLARATDYFGRYSGEAFLAVLTDTGVDDARIPMQRFREALKARGWDDVAEGLDVTFSCGLACHRAGESPEELLKRTDDALRQAKRDGRDCTRSG